MPRIIRQKSIVQIKRGPGRPRKHPRKDEFVTINLRGSERATSGGEGFVSCEWVRPHDGAQMRVVVPEIGSAVQLVRAFLGGER